MALTDEEVAVFARHHVEVWNTHRLDDILQLYTEDACLVSPLAAGVTGSPTVSGRDGLRAYFSAALERYPNLEFRIVNALRCIESVTLYYLSVSDLPVAEVMFLDEDKKITKVFAHYTVVTAT